MNERDKNYRLPKRVTLTIACVYIDNYKKNDDQGVIEKARDMLDEHNIGLSVWPESGVKQIGVNTLTYLDLPDLAEKGEVKHIPDEPWAYKYLRKAVDKKIKGQCTFVVPLPIIFCQFVYWGHGITPAGTKTESNLTRACLISQEVNKDKVTLVHEMGHAVPEIGDGHSPDEGNFMHLAEPRSTIFRFQVERFGKALFSAT
jgi:hypothetical protein